MKGVTRRIGNVLRELYHSVVKKELSNTENLSVSKWIFLPISPTVMNLG